MRTIRRIYLYSVSFLSLWAMLAGAALSVGSLLDSPSSSQAGTGLALLLASLPIFLVHYLLAEREVRLQAARGHADEATAPARLLFLYGLVSLSLLAALGLLLSLLHWVDAYLLQPVAPHSLLPVHIDAGTRLVAAAACAAVWFYFGWVLRRQDAHTPFALTLQRLLRYLWLGLALLLSAAGVSAMLTFLLRLPAAPPEERFFGLSHGLSFTLVGVPLLAWAALNVAAAGRAGGERLSAIRRTAFFLLACAGALVCLASAGGLLAQLIGWLLGVSQSLAEFLYQQAQNLAWLICSGAVWLAFDRALREDVALDPDLLRQAGVRRAYAYTLALLGLLTLLSGVLFLLNAQDLGGLARAAAAFLLGFPVWLFAWRGVQQEARLENENGDHARRSTLRRAYLYLVLFSLVAGSMAGLALLLRRVLSAGLAGVPPTWLALLGVWLAFLALHLLALRGDLRLAQRVLSQRHAAFRVAVFQNGEDATFTNLVVHALQREAPRMPILVHRLDLQPLDALDPAVGAVVLPWQCAVEPPPALQVWLKEYGGARLVAPLPAAPWHLAESRRLRPAVVAGNIARMVRELAENRS